MFRKWDPHVFCVLVSFLQFIINVAARQHDHELQRPRRHRMFIPTKFEDGDGARSSLYHQLDSLGVLSNERVIEAKKEEDTEEEDSSKFNKLYQIQHSRKLAGKNKNKVDKKPRHRHGGNKSKKSSEIKVKSHELSYGDKSEGSNVDESKAEGLKNSKLENRQSKDKKPKKDEPKSNESKGKDIKEVKDPKTKEDISEEDLGSGHKPGKDLNPRASKGQNESISSSSKEEPNPPSLDARSNALQSEPAGSGSGEHSSGDDDDDSTSGLKRRLATGDERGSGSGSSEPASTNMDVSSVVSLTTSPLPERKFTSIVFNKTTPSGQSEEKHKLLDEVKEIEDTEKEIEKRIKDKAKLPVRSWSDANSSEHSNETDKTKKKEPSDSYEEHDTDSQTDDAIKRIRCSLLVLKFELDIIEFPSRIPHFAKIFDSFLFPRPCKQIIPQEIKEFKKKLQSKHEESSAHQGRHSKRPPKELGHRTLEEQHPTSKEGEAIEDINRKKSKLKELQIQEQQQHIQDQERLLEKHRDIAEQIKEKAKMESEKFASIRQELKKELQEQAEKHAWRLKRLKVAEEELEEKEKEAMKSEKQNHVKKTKDPFRMGSDPERPLSERNNGFREMLHSRSAPTKQSTHFESDSKYGLNEGSWEDDSHLKMKDRQAKAVYRTMLTKSKPAEKPVLVIKAELPKADSLPPRSQVDMLRKEQEQEQQDMMKRHQESLDKLKLQVRQASATTPNDLLVEAKLINGGKDRIAPNVQMIVNENDQPTVALPQRSANSLTVPRTNFHIPPQYQSPGSPNALKHRASLGNRRQGNMFGNRQIGDQHTQIVQQRVNNKLNSPFQSPAKALPVSGIRRRSSSRTAQRVNPESAQRNRMLRPFAK